MTELFVSPKSYLIYLFGLCFSFWLIDLTMFHILKFEYVDTKGKMFLGFAGLFAGPCNFALKNDLSITGSEFAAEFALKTHNFIY